MKKVRVTMLSLALALGIAGAFATSYQPQAKRFDNPNWQTAASDGTIVLTGDDGGVYDPNRTLAQAQSDYGCSGNNAFCAVTVDSENGSETSPALFIKHP